MTFLTPPALFGGRDAERVFGCTYGLYPFPNLFILQAAAVLRDAGHAVRFIDGPVAGLDPGDLDRLLAGDDSDLVCLYSVNLSRVDDIETLRRIRVRRPVVPVVFFGPSPTWEPEPYLPDERCYVVRGEPEDALLELTAWLAGSAGPGHAEDGAPPPTAGVSTVRGGRAVHNAPRPVVTDLDRLPFPARELLDRDRYFNPKLGARPFTAMLTSRGCAFRCRYCVPCSLSFARELEYRRCQGGDKPRVALRSAANVVAELELLAASGYRALSILDDQFVWGSDRTVALCEALGRLGFRWGCLARADAITDDVARALAGSGCRYVDVGAESFDPRVLEDIGKAITADEVIEKLHLLKKHKVPFKLNILVGASPFETSETLRRTRRIAEKLGPDSIMFNICNPFPGTPFWDLAVGRGWLRSDGYVPVDVQKKSTVSYPLLSASQIEREVRRANRAFYLRPGFIWRGFARTRSLADLAGAVRALARKLF